MKKISFHKFFSKTKQIKVMMIWIFALATIPVFSYGQNNEDINPNSPLLTKVDDSIQEIVAQRIHMDLNPNIEHLRNTGQMIRKDIPPVDFSSLEFFPVIATPLLLNDSPRDSVLWVNKEFAFAFGKTENGDDIYIRARYKNRFKRYQDVNSAAYKELLRRRGQEGIDRIKKEYQNRSQVDYWEIVIYNKEDIMFQLVDYARQQSDDGKFFVLTKGENHFEICYFKDGKAISCRKSTKYDDIRIREFASLIR